MDDTILHDALNEALQDALRAAPAGLTLRRFTAGDDTLVFSLDSDPGVMRWINGGAPVTMTEVRSRLLPRFLADPGCLVIEWHGDSCGWVSLRASAGGNEAELGYRLLPTVWGRGIATSAAHAVITASFAATGIERVRATTYERNLASIRVMEKLGMRQRRRFRLTSADLANAATSVAGNTLWDGEDVEYAVTQAEWSRQSRSS